ncbi:MAG: TIM barrel protein, partial [Pararhizobium sp.]
MTRNRLSAHIGYLFAELPIDERIQAAAAAGFTAIEHPQPFFIPPVEMRAALLRNDLSFSQLAAGTGDPEKGEKGLAALPGRDRDFRQSFDVALEYAVAICSPFVHPMAGVPGDHSPEKVSEVYLENIRYAVEQTSGTNVKILIEAISQNAVPGYAMSTLEQACAVQDVFGPGNISLLVDTFHAQANGTRTDHWIASNIYRIGHIH